MPMHHTQPRRGLCPRFFLLRVRMPNLMKTFLHLVIITVCFIMWLGLVTVILLALQSAAEGSVTHPRPNSLGLSQVYENPNTYVLALPVEITMLGGGDYTNVRLKPFNTPMLYDESTLFCGDVRASFFDPSGKAYTEPLAITYDRIGHHMFQSLACHDLVSAVPVKGSL